MVGLWWVSEPVVGLLGMAAFSCASFRYVVISEKNPLESCVPFARSNTAIIQTLIGGLRTHGTGQGGSAVQEPSLCRPISQNLERRTCVEKLEVWTRKQTPYIFNKDGIVLKIHEKYVFFSFYSSHWCNIPTDIEIWTTCQCNRKHDTSIAFQYTGGSKKSEGEFLWRITAVEIILEKHMRKIILQARIQNEVVVRNMLTRSRVKWKDFVRHMNLLKKLRIYKWTVQEKPSTGKSGDREKILH
jgi:hypothetical protein